MFTTAPGLEKQMRQSVINIELFGMPRIVAGTRRIATTGYDLSEILQGAVAEVPTLREHIVDADGYWLNPGYTFVVDGQFSNDPHQQVSADSDILLVARASGG